MSHIRVISKGGLGRDVKVFHVADDGTETEISGTISRIVLDVAKPNKVQWAQLTAKVWDMNVEVNE